MLLSLSVVHLLQEPGDQSEKILNTIHACHLATVPYKFSMKICSGVHNSGTCGLRCKWKLKAPEKIADRDDESDFSVASVNTGDLSELEFST